MSKVEFTTLEMELIKCIKEHESVNAELFGYSQDTFNDIVSSLKKKGIVDGREVEEGDFLAAYFTEHWHKNRSSLP